MRALCMSVGEVLVLVPFRFFSTTLKMKPVTVFEHGLEKRVTLDIFDLFEL